MLVKLATAAPAALATEAAAAMQTHVRRGRSYSPPCDRGTRSYCSAYHPLEPSGEIRLGGGDKASAGYACRALMRAASPWVNLTLHREARQ